MRRSWLLLLTAPCLLGQDTEHETKEPKDQGTKDESGFRFVWKRHPSFRFGKQLRLDIRYRAQTDWMFLDQHVTEAPGVFHFSRNRLGVEGYVTRNLAYEDLAALGRAILRLGRSSLQVVPGRAPWVRVTLIE